MVGFDKNNHTFASTADIVAGSAGPPAPPPLHAALGPSIVEECKPPGFVIKESRCSYLSNKTGRKKLNVMTKKINKKSFYILDFFEEKNLKKT